jgi:AAA+ ATPase superfamily predicted ATPase
VAKLKMLYICHKYQKIGLMAEVQNKYSIIGRDFEIKRMKGFLSNNESELVAVLGRRRVGKTFLIKNVYQKEMIFHITGIQDVNRSFQLDNFVAARNQFFIKGTSFAKPNNWITAFGQLKELLGKPKIKKRVLFFDEFPWLANNSNEFLKAFDNFWNGWAIDQNLIVVICGSAASWMITNIINNKGGLHNRITQQILLQPFTLNEVERYFAAKKMDIPRHSLMQLYMVTGGIPYYLKEVQRGSTPIEAVNQMYFGKQATLKNEFDNLFKALFSNYEKHILVIRALASKWIGLTRNEIITKTKLPTGGAVTTILNELETSGFIQSLLPFGKRQRDTLYRLTDAYTLFYIHFVEQNKNIKNYWQKKYNSPEVKAWQGYAFENICLIHIDAIKQALGISGILTHESSFYKIKDNNTPGCQIDMLIERGDNSINICEIKFYDGSYILTDEAVNKLKAKRNIFQDVSKTKKQLFLTLVTANGLSESKYNILIDRHIDSNVLFNQVNF